MKKDNAIAIKKTYDIAKPDQVVAMATELKNYVVKQNLFTNIKGKNFAHVEGWQFAGFLAGLEAIIEETTDLSNDKEVKWKSVAYLYHNGRKIARGDALCSSKEATKKGFDEYAILSMSQTRAIGKVYRNKIGWVMKLAGYEATASEEMRKVDEKPADPVVVTPASTDSHVVYDDCICHGLTKSGCGNDVTPQVRDYSKRMYGKVLCQDCQKQARPIKK